MGEIYLFIITTYLLAGLFQGIIISVYENWYDEYTTPGEQILYLIIFMDAWPIVWIFEYGDWSKERKTNS